MGRLNIPADGLTVARIAGLTATWAILTSEVPIQRALSSLRPDLSSSKSGNGGNVFSNARCAFE